MKDFKQISNEELLSLYKLINEYIDYLNKEKSATNELGEKDVK